MMNSLEKGITKRCSGLATLAAELSRYAVKEIPTQRRME